MIKIRHSNFIGCVCLTLILLSAISLAAAPNRASNLLIWFDAPALKFTQSLPLGNGRLGAMVFGGVAEERIVLNESSLWSGSVQDADKPDAAQHLPEIRRLLIEGKNAEAEALVYKNFTAKGLGSARGRGKDAPYGAYQTLGNLRLTFANGDAGAMNYRRELNLANAVATVVYEQNGVRFKREYFASKPDEAIVVRLTADKPASINFEAALDRAERAQIVADGNNGLLMSGQLNNGTDGNGTKYAARLNVVNKGGNVSIIEKPAEKTLEKATDNKPEKTVETPAREVVRVENADEAILFVTAATNYNGFAGRRVSNELIASAGDLKKVVAKDYQKLLTAHIADFQKYFNRVGLSLAANDSASSNLPTPARLKAYSEGADDPNLATLYFQFGRYLLISSSRPGGMPANLQGIWAEEIQTPWNADWHLNINVQMNYWLAENANLSELHEPMFALIASLEKPGARTAKSYYNARGWVAHVLANAWVLPRRAKARVGAQPRAVRRGCVSIFGNIICLRAIKNFSKKFIR